MTGGVGPKGQNAQAGTVSGNFRVTNDDGSIVTGQIMCIGMDQPPSSGIFALHMACDAKSATGNVSIAYGCNWVGEEGAEDRPLACVGALQGKERDYVFYFWDITRYNLSAFKQGDDADKRKGELNVLMSRPKKNLSIK